MSIPVDDTDRWLALAAAATEPAELEPGKVYGWLSPDGHVERIDLTGDEHRTAPARKQGATVVWDVESFVEYYKKHADAHSEVYADVQRLTVTAVLDAHEPDAPRWGRHRLRLELRKTPEWQAWMAHHGQLLSQEAFAEHLEDHCAELYAPPAAEMLEIAQSIQATSKVEFKGGVRLSSGQRQLEFVETTTARAGQKGQLVIPDVFEIGLIPFEGSDPYRMSARFRYRISDGGQLKLGYRLDRPENTLQAAFADVRKQVGELIEHPVMNGSPS